MVHIGSLDSPCLSRLWIKNNVFMKSLISTAVRSGPLRAERRKRKVRHEIFTPPKLITARRSILGPPAEGRPGPSIDKLLFIDESIWCIGV